MQEPAIEELFNRLLTGTITPREREVLAEWIARVEDHDLEPRLEEAWKAFGTDETIPAVKADELLRAIVEKNALQEEGVARGWPLYVRMRKYAVAAAVVLVVFSAGLYWFRNSSRVMRPVAVVVQKEVAPPRVTNAVITLANGKKVLLDSARNGSVARQGGIDLVKVGDGELVYRGERSHQAGLQWNTITVPSGSRIASLTLSDGTRVWLNSGSSMTYPVAFEGKERQVSVNGEVYFEVAKDVIHPFIVAKGDIKVNVLGTHFNVNAYDDESNIRVTLLEGSIEVNNREARRLVAPGQMAIAGGGNNGADHRVETGHGIEIDIDADLDRVMAWRNGRFDFGNADIHSIMRELSRWYGLEVEYGEPVTEKFFLETSRDINVSDVFKILETTGGVHFQTIGKKIIVMR